MKFRMIGGAMAGASGACHTPRIYVDIMTGNPILDFATRLKHGPAAFAAWCSTSDPAVLDCLLREDFDCAVLDWQHGFHTFSTIQSSITLAHAANKAAMVRIGIGDFAEAARFLDWGASGIVAPMINSVADARQFVDFVKYPPLGGRSWGPSRAVGLTGLSAVNYLKQANTATLAIAMIETREALAALDDILAVDGIDGVLVGPSDLSIALTKGETVDANHPLVDAALTHIVNRTRAAGKIACAFCLDGARAGEMGKRGYHLSTIGSDTMLIRMVGKSEIAKARVGAKA